MSESKIYLFLLLALMLAAFTAPLSSSAPSYTPLGMHLKVYQDGAAMVQEAFAVNIESGILNVTLAYAPTEEPPIVEDEEGYLLPYQQEGQVLSIPVVNTSKVRVTYITHGAVVKRDHIWEVRVSYPAAISILLPPEATITGFSGTPEYISLTKEGLLLVFPKGSYTVDYVLSIGVRVINGTVVTRPQKPSQPSQPTTNQTSEAGTTKPAQPSGQQPGQQPLFGGNLLLIAGLAIIAVIAVLVIVLMKRGGLEVELRPEEEKIVEYLRSQGGAAYQHEITKALGLPKTTAWRYIRRLSEKGVVKIEKRYGFNYVILLE